ncbi:hypothetical protein BGW80DRAFT_1446904 [Lactifluus volemus]|nr:hypothetical protein BGW80DRAFT_1446904 [Lactifluus volemus]
MKIGKGMEFSTAGGFFLYTGLGVVMKEVFKKTTGLRVPGFLAYDVESGNLVYLKDYWRINHPDVQKEGDIYGELHEAHVPNIAKMSRACDVPRISGRGPLKSNGRSWDALNHFKSTRQLCEVIRDAIVAHTAAYNKTRILRRDVSAGNILITDKGTGILIDWDLSKKVKDREPKPLAHADACLLDPWSWPHEVSDDLESFFWVLLYEVVRYRNRRTTELKEIMQAVFDRHIHATRLGVTKGGDGKLTCVDGRKVSSAFIRRFVATPCRDIIEDMRYLFRDLYLNVTSDVPQSMMQAREDSEQDPKVRIAREKLQTSDALLAILDKHLQSEWDIDDDGSLDLSEPHADSSGSRSRRKRKAEDSPDGRIST